MSGRWPDSGSKIAVIISLGLSEMEIRFGFIIVIFVRYDSLMELRAGHWSSICERDSVVGVTDTSLHRIQYESSHFP